MIPELYDKFFVQKQDERRILFRKLADKYRIKKAIYPGSFVHITPSLFIPEMTYIDKDKRLPKFFSDSNTHAYINNHKTYDEPAKIHWYMDDFSTFNEPKEGQFDMMFSFYSGFISQHCKQLLKQGGLLVANNSHGDTSLAIADSDYETIAIILRDGDDFIIQSKDIIDYCTKKDDTLIDVDKVRDRMIGEKLKKPAFAHIFRKQA